MGGRQVKLSDEDVRARNRRNLVIALALLAFVTLVFVITIVQLKTGVNGAPN